MKQIDIIKCFAVLGERFSDWGKYYDSEFVANAQINNSWFTFEFIENAFTSLSKILTQQMLTGWALQYRFAETPKNIGLVAAGNIPLVAFHDILCILVSGNIAVVKLSTKDNDLYSLLLNELYKIDKRVADRIIFTEGQLKDVDAVIATGSNNTSRYFDYYFSKYPNIIRKNRNSIAVLTGNETQEQLQNLSNDVFTYFGLGCRNVSMLLVPENYKFDNLFGAFEKWAHLIDNNKYYNNIIYQRTVNLMNTEPFLESDFLLLKENDSLASPIGMIHYKVYKNEYEVLSFINGNIDNIQCIVSNKKWNNFTFDYGNAQSPELSDYADRVDTMSFLSGLI